MSESDGGVITLGAREEKLAGSHAVLAGCLFDELLHCHFGVFVALLHSHLLLLGFNFEHRSYLEQNLGAVRHKLVQFLKGLNAFVNVSWVVHLKTCQLLVGKTEIKDRFDTVCLNADCFKVQFLRTKVPAREGDNFN